MTTLTPLQRVACASDDSSPEKPRFDGSYGWPHGAEFTAADMREARRLGRQEAFGRAYDEATKGADTESVAGQVQSYVQTETDRRAAFVAGCSHWPGQTRCEVCGMGSDAV